MCSDRETGGNEIFALLDQVNSGVENDIDNLMNDSDTEFVLEKILENELNSEYEPLYLPECNEPLNVQEANYNVVENPAIQKTL